MFIENNYQSRIEVVIQKLDCAIPGLHWLNGTPRMTHQAGVRREGIILAHESDLLYLPSVIVDRLSTSPNGEGSAFAIQGGQ